MNPFKGKPSILNDEIDRVHGRMLHLDLKSDEYLVLLGHLERLVRLQKDEKSNRVSPDTMAIVGGNILMILIIVGYEHGHVIVSRGLQFILKTRHQ